MNLDDDQIKLIIQSMRQLSACENAIEILDQLDTELLNRLQTLLNHTLYDKMWRPLFGGMSVYDSEK